MTLHSSRLLRGPLRFVASSFALVALLTVAHAQEPPAAEPVDDRAPVPQVVESVRLENGMTVLIQPIEGMESVAVLVTMKRGSEHDPRNAPGLHHMLAELALASGMTSEGVSAHELNEELLEPRTKMELHRAYAKGWRSRAYHDHVSFGWDVASEDAPRHIREAVARLTHLSITGADIERAIDEVHGATNEKFVTKLPLAPRAWAEVLAFPHTSRATFGIDADRLRGLRESQVSDAWAKITSPDNVIMTITGNIGLTTRETLLEVAAAVPSNGASEASDSVTRKAVGKTGRKVAVDNLPGGREHVAVVAFAPPLDHPDHPAFLVVAEMLTMSAMQMPASQARLPFDYTLLDDPRAAYLTPHTAQYPKGAGQALGYWFVKIQNLRPSRSRAKRTRRSLGWQLGDPIIPIVLDMANDRPEMHLDIAHGVAFRELHGGSGFWDEYRARLIKQDPREMARVRTEYFTNQGWAFFWLQSQAPPPDRQRQRRQR